MKKILSFILAAVLLFGCIQLSAVTANVTVNFTPSPENPANIEHFVEREVGGTWAEIAKGPTAPLTATIQNIQPGTVIRVRVRSRLWDQPGTESAPSNEAAVVVPPKAPSNVGIILTVQ